MKPGPSGREVASHLAAFCFLGLATLALHADVVRGLGTSIGPSTGDPVFVLYLLKWGSHQLPRGLDGFWNAPFFYPTPDVMAFADHLQGPAVAFFALRALGVPSLAAYNVLVLLTFVLGGFAAYWVVRHSAVSASGALVAGWAFAFSSFRWGSWGHFQVLRMQWIPLAMWTFDRLLAKPTPTRAAVFLLFYALHVSGGAYLAYLLHIALAILLVNRWWSAPASLRRWGSWAAWIPAGLLAVGITLFLYRGYLAHGSTLMIGGHPSAMRRGSALLATLMPDPVRQLLSDDALQIRFFPPLAIALLVVYALALGARRFANPAASRRRLVAGMATVAAGLATSLAGLLLADRFTLSGESLLPTLTGRGMTGYVPPLVVVAIGGAVVVGGARWSRRGRVLRWSEMPVWPRGLLVSGAVMTVLCLPAFFWALSTVLPGMQSMRVAHRAFAFVALPIAYLAGVGWDGLRTICRGRAWRLVATAIAALLLAETVIARPHFSLETLPEERDFPPYAHWIARRQDVGAYLELPLAIAPFDETVPMYFQTLHWRPLANGFSARRPPSFRRVMALCRPFPDARGLRELAEGGITHLVVHWQPLPWQAKHGRGWTAHGVRAAFERELHRSRARVVFADGGTEVFDIRAAAAASFAEPDAAGRLPDQDRPSGRPRRSSRKSSSRGGGD